MPYLIAFMLLGAIVLLLGRRGSVERSCVVCGEPLAGTRSTARVDRTTERSETVLGTAGITRLCEVGFAGRLG